MHARLLTYPECRALDQVLEKSNQKKECTHPIPRRFFWERKEGEHTQKDAVGPTVKLITSLSAAPAWPLNHLSEREGEVCRELGCAPPPPKSSHCALAIKQECSDLTIPL